MGRQISLFLLLGALAACSGASTDDARTTWLQNTLIEDNRALMLRAPDLTSGKLLKMNSAPYLYFRGTAAQYWRDVRGPGQWARPTAFGNAATSDILLVGDPHPENYGSYKPADGLYTIDLSDFDGARRGPYHFDLRRLAIGFWVAGAAIGFDETQRRELADAVARGYSEQISEGGAFRIERNNGYGPVVDDLFRRAVRDGEIREELDEYTRLEDGRRTMFFGEVEPAATDGLIGDEVTPVTDEDRRLIDRLLADYWESLIDPPPHAARTVVGMSRRLGAGVSSYSLLRWYVLVEGETTAPEDDLLLEVKEIVDPPSLLGVAALPQRQHQFNAERVVDIQRALQTTNENDPMLGWASDGQQSFRIRQRTKFQKNVSVDRLGEKLDEDWTYEDLVFHAETCGRLLAATHRRGAPDAADEIASFAGDGMVAETVGFAVDYGEQVLADHARLDQLLRDEGPLLGFDPTRFAR